MKKIAACLIAAGAIGSAAAQTSVGVSIGVNEPGVYGRINIGNFPPPPLVYAQPVVIVPAPMSVHRAPIYLYVPVAHQQRWSRYCSGYNACGQPVYFVQERWVRDRYEHDHPGWDRGRGNKHKEHRGGDEAHGHGKSHGHD
jgi:hypothetical protein